MNNYKRKTLGLALSGAGNRTSFHIGFLEFLDEQKIPIDYISTTSGGCLAAAAYACGTLNELKDFALNFDLTELKKFLKLAETGGIYSLDLLEEKIRQYTKGLTFEQVHPRMSFVAVDINTGDKINLCVGDIARAARISCTLPGLFQPVVWGGKILVDGGLLTTVPVEPLEIAGVDVKVGLNLRGTKHIFTDEQIKIKQAYNEVKSGVKKVLLLNVLEEWLEGVFKPKEEDGEIELEPSLFQVWGKSLDLAIEANKLKNGEFEKLDLLISPNVPLLKRTKVTKEAMMYYYQAGRLSAEANLPKIIELINL
jgi:predicted acylesterase/phospholipase RssA